GYSGCAFGDVRGGLFNGETDCRAYFRSGPDLAGESGKVAGEIWDAFQQVKRGAAVWAVGDPGVSLGLCRSSGRRDARLPRRQGCLRPNPSLRFRQIRFVDLEANKFFHVAILRRNSRISDSQKWIEHGVDARNAV